MTAPLVARKGGELPLQGGVLFLNYETSLGIGVLATPIFEALKSAAPEVPIAVACGPLMHRLLSFNPYVDRLILTEPPTGNFPRAAWQLRRALKGFPLDCCVTDTGNMRTLHALLAIASGARRRAGFTFAPDYYHESRKRSFAQGVWTDNLSLLSVLGLTPRPVEPRIFFSDRERLSALALLRAHGIDEIRPLALMVAKTSGGQPSAWYDDRLAAVADHLVERGFSVLFVGGASHRAAIDAIRGQMVSPSANVAGETEPALLSALMCQADLVVTLDTGPMHIARAAQVPTVIVAPAWQPPTEWLPLGSPHCLILRRNDIACRECLKFHCATRECMDEITTADVLFAIDRQIGAFPPDPAARRQRTARCLTEALRA